VLLVHSPTGEHRDDAGPRCHPTWLAVKIVPGISGR